MLLLNNNAINHAEISSIPPSSLRNNQAIEFHLKNLDASDCLGAAVTTLAILAGVFVGLGSRGVKGIRLALLADVGVARAEEVGALLANGQVVCGLVGGLGGGASDHDAGEDGEGRELHFGCCLWW